ncbi:MAG TPA: phage tail sheath C-terminal domain-containing protein, partial [Beijerinckiaceae bacterium]|nr:phage tail sheath C-terminal domain-containing protein [Beijerinckiaceae bacterium]
QGAASASGALARSPPTRCENTSASGGCSKFLERSIYEGTQWVVFEPNDERLWEWVKDTIRLFLSTQWRNGALMGLTEEQAFMIACDRSTMTQDDILNGRLVCEIGIAPVRPAEFVIFRIFQNTAEAQS